MFDPRVLISTNYPPNFLDTHFNENENLDTVHYYVDFKNSYTGFFISDIVQEMVSNKQYNRPESSVLQSLIHMIAAWKYFCLERNKKLKVFICTDQGKSTYHNEINKEYKAQRKISPSLLPLKEPLEHIIYDNMQIFEKIYKHFGNVFYFNLKFLESDFLPYWLITRIYKGQDNILHVISSNDKDHYQSLLLPNTIMYSKKQGISKEYNKTTILADFMKIHTIKNQNKMIKVLDTIRNINPEYITVLMSMVGDASDNVKGATKVGPMTTLELFSNTNIVNSILGDLNVRRKEILEDKNLFDFSNVNLSTDKKWSKIIEENDTITKAFKQIDYEMLCMYLEQENNLHKVKHLKYMNEQLNYVLEESTPNLKDVIKENIKKMRDIRIHEKSLDYLFL